MTARATSTSDVTSRTAAATAARRRRYLQQQAERLGWLIPEMADFQLVALAGLIAEELGTRRQPTDSATECVEIRHAAAESGDG